MIEKTQKGYIVYTMRENARKMENKLYIRRVYAGQYTFTLDYTHARAFSKKTAAKHDKILNGATTI